MNQHSKQEDPPVSYPSPMMENPPPPAPVSAPPPMGHPSKDAVCEESVPQKTRSRCDGFLEGCCVVLCYCCFLDCCF
ncbi:hypothetical protein QN277_001699 [Acacia crassicarpa]|uniref:Cysteine-rich transmembrane CYSTM domain-containing protein n=1 Tax=Acacia crassicarpa TaxID=499986 RepID=A0AAE1N967_9FABA|nr:hypothetical protein QN277_001699 [Acacia crassicarpa]